MIGYSHVREDWSEGVITEADTCRKYVLPKLYAAGWTDDQISEQKTFTDGRIVVAGNKVRRLPQKRADYLLRYTRDFMIAVIEAKAAYKNAGDGLQQAKEQRRIVVRIEELAAKIEDARGLRQQAVEKIERMLASASEAAFKPQPGWTEARVKDFCGPPQYGFTASATSEEIGPRFLRITDIQNAQVNWNNVPFCHCPNPEPYLLQDNDLVFARTGATTGKSFVIRSCPKAVFASYLIRLRVQRLVTTEYLYRYFQTPSYWSQIIDEKKGTGQPNVNGKKLANLRVPVPPPEEQRQIVAYLDALQTKVDMLKRLEAETADELDALLPSILDKAFKGEL